MEIVLLIKVFSQSNNVGLTYTKSYDSSIAPSIGDKIQDALFAELKLITNVFFDYSKNQCYVVLESKKVPDDRLDGHIQEVAAMHDWKEINKEA